MTEISVNFTIFPPVLLDPGMHFGLEAKGFELFFSPFAGLKYSSVISTCLLNIQRHDQVVHISLIQTSFTGRGFVPDITMLPSTLT